MRLRRVLSLAVIILILAATGGAGVVAGAGSGTPPTPPDAYAPGEILVKFRPGTTGQAIADAHRQNGGQVKSVIPGIDVQVVAVPVGQEVARVAAYQRNPNVLFAEVNGLYHAVWVPNDPQVTQQWQYNNTGQSGGTVDADIDAFEAWSVTTGSDGVKIAILDTGIDLDHEDLQSKVVANMNFTNSGTADDKYGHGTHVAGSAAAITNNGTGVAGTCPNCVLQNVKVLGDNGSGSWDWIANGIIWAADHGANVINLSLGASSASSTLEAAVNHAWDNGVIVVAAAGNDGVSSTFYPAAYANVIAVAATDRNDQKASFSNYGADWVDVAAPGDSILSTAPNHRNRIWFFGVSYGTISGTSMASPHVAGVAGLVWSSGLCSTNSCVRKQIEDTADEIAGTGSNWLHGRVNACNAVGGSCSTSEPTPTATLTPTQTPTPTQPPASSPTSTPTPTETPISGDTPTPTPTATATPAPDAEPSVHVADLDASSSNVKNTWTATVLITVHDQDHNSIASGTVHGVWTGTTGATSCTISDGQCSVTSASIPKKTGSVTFTVTDVTGGPSAYDSSANHDSDGDSDGTTITVVKP